MRRLLAITAAVLIAASLGTAGTGTAGTGTAVARIDWPMPAPIVR